MGKNEFEGISALDGIAYHVVMKDGIIKSISEIKPQNDMLYFSPGFIDTQVNGYLGYDYSDQNLTENNCIEISRKLVGSGTFQHFATIVTRPRNIILKNIRTIVNARKKNSFIKSSISGIHIEGPYISKDDGPRGAHDKYSVRPADKNELDSWMEIANGLIKVITIAPEAKNAIKFIEYATKLGIVCAIGHTNANEEQIAESVIAGARISTHLGNGSDATIDRFDNHIWPQLADDRLSISIIADLAHVPKSVLKIFANCKKENQIILISDLSPMAGLKKGLMKWGNLDVEITDDGYVHLAGTPYLAGASSFLVNNISNFVRSTNYDLSKAIRMVTINPTNLYSLDRTRVSFIPGLPAEFIVFDWDEKIKKINLKTIVKEKGKG